MRWDCKKNPITVSQRNQGGLLRAGAGVSMVKTDPVYKDKERKTMLYVSVLEKLRSNGLSRHCGDSHHLDTSCVHAPRA